MGGRQAADPEGLCCIRLEIENPPDGCGDGARITRVADFAEGPVRVVDDDPAEAGKVARDDRDTRRDGFEQLVGSRQDVVERARLEGHHVDVGTGHPRDDLTGWHRAQHVKTAAEARLAREDLESPLLRPVAKEDRVGTLETRYEDRGGQLIEASMGTQNAGLPAAGAFVSVPVAAAAPLTWKLNCKPLLVFKFNVLPSI